MNELLFKSELVRAGFTQGSLAKAMGMAQSTMTRKIKNGTFTIDEANAIVDLVGIKNPCEIFFARKVT